MIIREVLPEEKEAFNSVAAHPLQSWEWGEFRENLGQKVIRLGAFEDKKLISGYQLTIHTVPKTDYTILYLPKGPLPDKAMLETLAKIGKEEKAIFTKMEPEIPKNSGFDNINDFLLKNNWQPGKPIFSKYTLWVDLTKSEEELMTNMHPKTRYNVHLAQKHGVVVEENSSPEGFKTFLKLHFETTEREKFYSHTPLFHQKMWEALSPAGIAHVLIAKYQNIPLTAWVLFTFNNQLYYPYGGSSRDHREVMPSYAMMWEAMRFGKKNKCQNFDLWGVPSPDPQPSDPWYGFHRFKMGFNPKLVEYIGAYDLVLNQPLYTLYNLADRARWLYLRAKSKLPF